MVERERRIRRYASRGRRVRSRSGGLYTAPVTVWITVFFVVPLAIVVLYSFLEKGLYGGVRYRFSLDAYRALANPLIIRVAWTTFRIALASTIGTVLLALPAAYYIARSSRRTMLLVLIIVPFWTNFLIRVYAWMAILGTNGFLNTILLSLGIIGEPVRFLYNQWAVIVVLIYTSLPFAILPLYASIEKFDFTLIEAARDLGASRLAAIVRIMIPNIRAGIVTAILFTFIPNFGEYAVPQLVGGRDSFMIGNVIARELTVTRNWPLAAAMALIITVITAGGMVVYSAANRTRGRGSGRRV
ncbi:MAG: ABC transporter permease [Spirochaetaceae bacterium]|nr:MAG: ABC transporter permease [Spirochaetaceae bacterium]